MNMKLDYEVVIVGGGPIGVLTANFLGQYGVKTLLVDREPDVINIPRAVGLCEEGSRILSAANLLDDLAPDLVPLDDLFFRDKELRPLFRIGVNRQVNGNPMLRTLHQPDTERVFRRGLKRYGCVDFWRNTECLQFNDLGHQVQLQLRRHTNDSEEKLQQVRCRYLLACDGARSHIRKMLPTEFEGHTYAQDWLVIDIENDPVAERSEAYFICDPYRPAVTMPTPNGGRRWEFVVRDNESSEFITSDDAIRELLKPWGNLEDMNVCRKTVYTFHAVVSRKFQVGNVFLMGDAAHLTPPFAGQGLMAGMRDAFNLTWKLAHVLQGKLPEDFLRTYELERRPQSDLIVRLAQFLGIIILPQNPLLARLRDVGFALGKRFLACQEDEGRASLHKMANNMIGYKALRYWTRDPKQLMPGFELPQFPVATVDEKEPVPFDSLLGSHHTIIGFDCVPQRYLNTRMREQFEQIGGRYCCIRAHNALEMTEGLQVIDSAGEYANLLENGRRVLIIRPDRMLVSVTTPEHLEKDLRQYLNSLGIRKSAELPAPSLSAVATN